MWSLSLPPRLHRSRSEADRTIRLSPFAPPEWQAFRRSHHTSSAELAAIANKVRPKLLVLYHPSNAGAGPRVRHSDDVLINEIQQTYKGKVVAGRDLDVF